MDLQIESFGRAGNGSANFALTFVALSLDRLCFTADMFESVKKKIRVHPLFQGSAAFYFQTPQRGGAL